MSQYTIAYQGEDHGDHYNEGSVCQHEQCEPPFLSEGDDESSNKGGHKLDQGGQLFSNAFFYLLYITECSREKGGREEGRVKTRSTVYTGPLTVHKSKKVKTERSHYTQFTP